MKRIGDFLSFDKETIFINRTVYLSLSNAKRIHQSSRKEIKISDILLVKIFSS